MKKYDDLTARLLARRDRYVADQKQKQQRMLRIALPAGGGLLVALLCVGLWQGGAFDPAELPVEPSEEITTTATTEGGADGDDTVTDPTANPTDPTVNDSTIPSTTVPADIVTDVVSGTDTTTEVTQILTTTGSTHTTADTTVTTVTTTDVTPSNTVIGDSTHTTADTTEDATVPTVTVPTDIIPTVNHSTTVDDGTTADKTTSATGKPHSTTTTEQPTTEKTDPTTGTIGKPTKNTTTSKTKPTTKPTATTGTTVKPSSSKVTDPTTTKTETTVGKTDPTTQTTATTQSHYNDDEFDWDGDMIVVGATEFDDLASCPSGDFALSAKLPAVIAETEEYVPIALSYGFLTEIEFMEFTEESITVVTVKVDYAKENIIKKFTVDDVYSSKYFVDRVYNGRSVRYVFSHTEMVYVPLSSLSNGTGEILIQMKSYNPDINLYTGEYRTIYYAHSKNGIIFSTRKIELPY